MSSNTSTQLVKFNCYNVSSLNFSSPSSNPEASPLAMYEYRQLLDQFPNKYSLKELGLKSY